jgi:hypothetical protein
MVVLDYIFLLYLVYKHNGDDLLQSCTHRVWTEMCPKLSRSPVIVKLNILYKVTS